MPLRTIRAFNAKKSQTLESGSVASIPNQYTNAEFNNLSTPIQARKSTTEENKTDLQLPVKEAMRLGHNFANVKVTPTDKTPMDKPIIQRKLVVHKPKSADRANFTQDEEKDQKEAETQAAKVDKLVETAFDEFKQGNFDGASDAQKALYIKRKYEFDKGTGLMHPSTAAGYVIEGKANVGIKKLGFATQGTDILDGTRPDVIINLQSGQLALVDITAFNSIGHIFKKKGEWTNQKNIPYVAESVYPSIDFNNVNSTTPLSQEQIAKAIELVDKRRIADELAKEEWIESQRNDYYINQQMLSELLREVCDFGKEVNQKLIDNRLKSRLSEVGLEVNIDTYDFDYEIIETSYEEMEKKHWNFTINTALVNKIKNWLDIKIKASKGQFPQSKKRKFSDFIENSSTTSSENSSTTSSENSSTTSSENYSNRPTKRARKNSKKSIKKDVVLSNS